MTTRAELQALIDVAWRENRPLTTERALELALEVLADHPRERAAFTDWFEVHGEWIVKRTNDAVWAVA